MPVLMFLFNLHGHSRWRKFSFIQVILVHRGLQKLLGLFQESGKCFSFLLSVTTEEASWMRGVLPTVWVTLEDLETPTHCRLLARLSWHRSLLFDVEHTWLTIPEERSVSVLLHLTCVVRTCRSEWTFVVFLLWKIRKGQNRQDQKYSWGQWDFHGN